MKNVKITLVRHGKTAKATTDAERRLTDEGVDQANARRTKLGNPNFDLVISSIAVRAQQTAHCVAANGVNIGLAELYLPTIPDDKTELDVLFAKLLYAPLQAYYDAGAQPMLQRYGQTAANAIRKAIDVHNPATVLITGHAVMLNAVGLALGGDEAALLALNLGEAEGFTIHPDGSLTLHQG